MAEASIWVEPLGEPAPPPDQVGGAADAAWGEELRRELEPEEDWVGWATERMIPAAQAAYRVAGVVTAIAVRAPIDEAWRVWATEPDEVRPVVAALLPMIPRTPLASFIVGRLPAGAAIVQGAGLALDRIRATRALTQEEDLGQHGASEPDRATADERRVLGVGSIPFAAEQGGADGRHNGARREAPGEPAVAGDRPTGGPLDGTVPRPEILRTLVGGRALARR